MNHTFCENAIITSLLVPAARTGGTAIPTTFVPVISAPTVMHNTTLLLNVGTVTAGSITMFSIWESNAANGAGSALLTGGTLVPGGGGTTAGVYAIEVRTPRLDNGSIYVGCNVVIPAGGSAVYSVTAVQTNPMRQAPVSNGLAGSLLLLH